MNISVFLNRDIDKFSWLFSFRYKILASIQLDRLKNASSSRSSDKFDFDSFLLHSVAFQLYCRCSELDIIIIAENKCQGAIRIYPVELVSGGICDVMGKADNSMIRYHFHEIKSSLLFAEFEFYLLFFGFDWFLGFQKYYASRLSISEVKYFCSCTIFRIRKQRIPGVLFECVYDRILASIVLHSGYLSSSVQLENMDFLSIGKWIFPFWFHPVKSPSAHFHGLAHINRNPSSPSYSYVAFIFRISSFYKHGHSVDFERLGHFRIFDRWRKSPNRISSLDFKNRHLPKVSCNIPDSSEINSFYLNTPEFFFFIVPIC
ncbi:MAG: hypothetical protein ACD_2C00120G0001 [uncultured bacterium (gcode 4)]|uniref:Uncharacterized protein n=1 Tax=uncultured bacterium (gcode 4) TaxID=1234023 RepID=K2FER7_9BACT|nr:MAG: hypothetical protein ACD_2C00120G0001 [uncultured bacterium (gcode 4)]